jgi:2-C-methyl-D-erythritol 4-phosphate cytidylyltransferase
MDDRGTEILRPEREELMIIALIFAAGVGSRMGQDIPKQFMHIGDKPVVIYALEAFQRHPEIDEIAVVCLDGWHEMLRSYARQFSIDKLKIIVSGGASGQESIKNGIAALSESHDSTDLVLIHDGIRPMVSQEIISDAIVKCQQYGSAVSFLPSVEAIMFTDDAQESSQSLDHSKIGRAQAPQAYPLGKLVWAENEAEKRGIVARATSSLMIELGETVHLSLGSEKNIKLTTLEDIEIFRALLQVEKEANWYRK